MGSQSSQKNKPEAFAYSWFMPAPGSETEPVPEAAETAESGKDSETPEDQTGYYADVSSQPSNPTVKKQSLSGVLRMVKPRTVGLVAWSGVAAVGMAAILARSGPFPGLQVGAVAGVWAAVAAVIWILPSKLPK